MHTDNIVFTPCKITILMREILMHAFNRKMYVNTGKLSAERGQSKLSLGILDKTQKQTHTKYRLLGVQVNQKKTSGGREELRQLISRLITSKAIPRQLIHVPLVFPRQVHAINGKSTFQFTAWII